MRSCLGLTFIELLVGLSLLAIVMLFSTPSLDLVFKKNKLELRVDEITRIIKYARNSALLKGKTLILMPIKGDKDWSAGMKLIYRDNGNFNYDKSDTPEIDHEWRWDPAFIKIDWNGFVSNNYLIFAPEIRSNSLNGYFNISYKNNSYKLTLNRLARVNTTYSGKQSERN
jgi:type IV fimbrial biogenesis protein FimT